jgi:DNA-binding NtrC family response regulator
LVVDDEVGIRRLCTDVLKKSGHPVEAVADASAALARLEDSPADLVISDIKMKGMDGLAFLEKVRERTPNQRFILITGYPTLATAVEGMKLGARNYVTKPFTPTELRAAVADALEDWVPPAEPGVESGDVDHLGALVASSEVMKALFGAIRRIAATDATVLITGESGTGKELVAKALHLFSQKRDQHFVAVNCSALVDSLMESELFGHVKGAFTGANAQKSGLFQYANGGTLFLDEIGDLALSLQPKLLRVLQEGEFKPVGSVKDVAVDVRIIAATHRDLETSVESGSFREDLFYRLNVIRIDVPPLRERREDILPISRAFLVDFGRRLGRKSLHLNERAVRALMSHDWPGNVRELRNTLLRAATLAPTDDLGPDDLLLGSGKRPPQGNRSDDFPYQGLPLEEVERRHILRHLEKFEGNRSQTARALGINRTTLWKKLSRYGIEE